MYCFDVGAGQPVVLIHGFANTGRSWSAQVSALIKRGFRVLVPDLTGHGASRSVSPHQNMKECAQAIYQLLKNRSVNTPVVAGVSLGGMIAITMAIDQPDAIRALVIADSFEATTGKEFDEMLASWKTELSMHDAGPQHRLEVSWPDLVNSSFSESARGAETLQAWHAIAAQADGDALATMAEAMRGFDVSDRLHKVSCPTLLLRGEFDPMVTEQDARRMADKIRGARYEEILGSKHLPNVDNAEAFNDVILSWLDEVVS